VHKDPYATENWSTFGDDMDKSLRLTLFGHPVRFVGNFSIKWTRCPARMVWTLGKSDMGGYRANVATSSCFLIDPLLA